MIYLVIFALIAYLFYYIHKVNKDLAGGIIKLDNSLKWRFGEDSHSRLSLSLAKEEVFDRPLIRRLLNIDEKYNDKKSSELPSVERKKMREFARNEGMKFYPSFLFFYDKGLVFTKV